MAYFSNGTEGELFQSRFCSRCINNKETGCTVWDIHLAWNSDQHQNQSIEAALSAFIPQDKSTCRMFTTEQDTEKEKQAQRDKELLDRWKSGKGLKGGLG